MGLEEIGFVSQNRGCSQISTEKDEQDLARGVS